MSTLPNTNLPATPSGSISILGGVFEGCVRETLLTYPTSEKNLKTLESALCMIIGKSFTVRGFHLVDYGCGYGPGIWIPLAESSLLLGAWPERNRSVDFLLHYCGDNYVAAMICVQNLAEFAGAACIRYSPLTPEHPVHFIDV